MTAIKKPKIEAIFPLSYMQQGLLFHHLSNKNDQGYLNVECAILGEIDIATFEKTWNLLVQRHAVLRTTVHWKNIAKPVTIVHFKKFINLKYLDWSNIEKHESKVKWNELKKNKRASGVNLEKDPLLDITLVKCKNNSYQLLWPSHHLLIDGWSSQVILNDFLITYDALKLNLEIDLPSIPSLKSYYTYKHKQSKKDSKDFWISYFKNVNDLPLFSNNTVNTSHVGKDIRTYNLNTYETEKLQELSRRYKVTLNTLIQGAWTYLISKYFGTNEISFGSTVSGRSSTFPNIEFLTGMLMDVQPVRIIVDKKVEISEWLQNIQRQQQLARLIEYGSLDEITAFINWPEAKPIFDNLLIFENFPQTESTSKVLEIQDFKSGITSTYPVTLVVIPGNEIKFNFTIEQSIVDEKSINWILGNWKKLIQILISNTSLSFDLLDSEIEFYKNEVIENNAPEVIKYVAPQSKTEVQLTKIWQKLFDLPKIGVNDDFFDLGGKSMLAIRLISIINKELNAKLLPTTLLKNSTIASIAGIIEKKVNVFSGKFVVPIRASGNLSPLFCVHAGMGHVFFYNNLTKFIEIERPVYAVQPAGLYDDNDMHSSIEQMAKEYMNEMIQINPTGPYNIMVYCWSTAVGLEMAIQFKKLGKETNLMVMDTIAIVQNLYKPERTKLRVQEFFERLYNNPVAAMNSLIKKRIKENVIPKVKRVLGNKNQRVTQKLRSNLLKIYYAYKWPHFEGNITLMITPDTWDERLYAEIIASWEKIPTMGLNVIQIKGVHSNLFDEPTVEFTAHSLEDCMRTFEDKNNL
ncbi:hypothetical protein GH721_01655 [Kriegella sp. EG-1]|nr:hypothetical protein [Flavobacteriaceae bacterium EG-1]